MCGPGGDDFILFSYLNSKGTIGEVFFVSAADPVAPHRFGQELEKQKQPKQEERIVIHTSSGPDVTVGLENESIYMAGAIQDDIEEQCLAFFNDRPMYCRLNVPYKRGFLFVGQPGTGKTMMIRNVIRKVCSRHKHIKVSALTGGSTTDNAMGFFMAQGESEAPVIMILEELDSLAKQSKVTRAGLLTQLDGLEPHEGLMVLATTNNPGEVDPALMHRPRRFDRVWRFDLPDAGLRRRYMEDKFGGCSGEVLDTLARKSEGWTFAYLNELRVTAGVIAIREHGGQSGDVAMLKAHRLLAAQYEAGRKNHVMAEAGPAMGFKSE